MSSCPPVLLRVLVLPTMNNKYDSMYYSTAQFALNQRQPLSLLWRRTVHLCNDSECLFFQHLDRFHDGRYIILVKSRNWNYSQISLNWVVNRLPKNASCTGIQYWGFRNVISKAMYETLRTFSQLKIVNLWHFDIYNPIESQNVSTVHGQSSN